MTLAPRSGSGTSTLQDLQNAADYPDVPPSSPTTDPNYQTPSTVNDEMENMPFVMDPALDRQAFDQTQYPQAVTNLLGYMEGHRITVTYFNLLGQMSDIRTNIADYNNERAILHNSYKRINNCELTLNGPWEEMLDQEKMQGQITGIAFMYPGMNPNIGDVFLAPAGDNKTGMFKITSVNVTSWRNQRCYQVGFYLYNWPDQGDFDILRRATRQVVYFDKANYLGDIASLLQEDKYLDLQTMRRMRDVLSKYYYRTFYDQNLGSFFRPDGLYDPYVTKFMASKCSFRIVKRRARQLLATVDNLYDHTIWSRLQEYENAAVDDLYPYYILNNYVGTTADVGITDLQGYNYIVPTMNTMSGSVSNPSYVFSPAFYQNHKEAMTTFESMVHHAIHHRSLTDTTTLITMFLNKYKQYPVSDQFYQIPVYLQLIDIAVPSISRLSP